MKIERHPFKHIVIDNFLPKKLAEILADKFPIADKDWYEYNNVFEKKRAMDRLDRMPGQHASVLQELNTHIFMDEIEKMFGIEGLVPDPSFRGGGLHQIFPNGKLDIHVDFNFHKKLKLDRRINAILYLNKNWQVEWGGHLELWDKEMKGCIKRIAPAFNRMVIFETTDFSYHGHPDPLRCPEGRTRNSMAWYYYSRDRPPEEKNPDHSTMFQKRPQDKTTKEIEEFRKKRGEGRV